MKGEKLIELARKYVGKPYVLGAFVPKDNQDYAGAFDCAEFVAFIQFQITGKLYGCDTADVSKAAKADAYTGYFDRDANKRGVIIPVDQAIRTPGAMLLRVPTGSAIGHIAFSQGDGKTIEAHSSKYGVIESVADGRRWSYGILLPFVAYSNNGKVPSKAPSVVYRLKSPYMLGDFVGKIQRALRIPTDTIYGPKTQAAVVEFQKANGLIPDGEVMPGGETARALNI